MMRFLYDACTYPADLSFTYFYLVYAVPLSPAIGQWNQNLCESEFVCQFVPAMMMMKMTWSLPLQSSLLLLLSYYYFGQGRSSP